jgi:hypothetical protein
MAREPKTTDLPLSGNSHEIPVENPRNQVEKPFTFPQSIASSEILIHCSLTRPSQSKDV